MTVPVKATDIRRRYSCWGSVLVGLLLALASRAPAAGEIIPGRQVNELVCTWQWANPGGYFPESEWSPNLVGRVEVQRSWGELTYRYTYVFSVGGLSVEIVLHWVPKRHTVDSPVVVGLQAARAPVSAVTPAQRAALVAAGYAIAGGVTIGDSRSKVQGLYGTPDALEDWPFHVFYVPPGDLAQLDHYGNVGIAFGYALTDSGGHVLTQIYVVKPVGLTAIAPRTLGLIKRGLIESH
jgi:hypothetical protein